MSLMKITPETKAYVRSEEFYRKLMDRLAESESASQDDLEDIVVAQVLLALAGQPADAMPELKHCLRFHTANRAEVDQAIMEISLKMQHRGLMFKQSLAARGIRNPK